MDENNRNMKQGMQITMKDTLYVPNLMVNLFSLTKVLSEGSKVITTKEGWMGVTMDNKEMIFDIPMKSNLGVVYAAYIKPVGISVERDVKQEVKKNINDFHEQLGHIGEDQLRRTANLMGIKLKGTLKKCEGCARGKIKARRINPLPMFETSKPLERYGMDISSCSATSLGGKKYWVLWMDYAANFTWSMFLKHKSDLVGEGVRFLRRRLNNY